MSQLRQYQDELKQLKTRVYLVSYESNELAMRYIDQLNLDWPLLMDPDRDLYRAYGMSSIKLWEILKPASMWRYWKLIQRGEPIQKPGSDWRQAGGNVVVDPQQIVRLHHVSQSPHDRPTAIQMLDVIRTGSGETSE